MGGVQEMDGDMVAADELIQQATVPTNANAVERRTKPATWKPGGDARFAKRDIGDVWREYDSAHTWEEVDRLFSGTEFG